MTNAVRLSAPWVRRVNDELALLEEKKLTGTERRYLAGLEREDDPEYGARLIKQTRDAARMERRSLDPAGLPARLSESDRVRWRALSDLAYRQASSRDDVQAFRRAHLRGSFVPLDQIGRWAERMARREGGADRRAGLFEYPAATHVARIAMKPNGILARLRELSLVLARQYGWQPAQAVAFVACDAVPIISLISTTLHWDYPAGPRVQLDVDPEADPELVLSEYRRARAELLGPKVQPAQPHTLQAAVAGITRVGSWPSAWRAWKIAHPEHPYSGPRALRTAARDGLRVLSRSRPWVADFETELLRSR